MGEVEHGKAHGPRGAEAQHQLGRLGRFGDGILGRFHRCRDLRRQLVEALAVMGGDGGRVGPDGGVDRDAEPVEPGLARQPGDADLRKMQRQIPQQGCGIVGAVGDLMDRRPAAWRPR